MWNTWVHLNKQKFFFLIDNCLFCKCLVTWAHESNKVSYDSCKGDFLRVYLLLQDIYVRRENTLLIVKIIF